MPQLGIHPTPLKPISGASGPVHHFTCRHEEDAGTKDDVVSGFVELAGCNAESTHEKQNHTQDRENTRGSNSPCGGERERGRKNSAGVKERKKGHGNSGGARGHEHVLCVEAKGERQRATCGERVNSKRDKGIGGWRKGERNKVCQKKRAVQSSCLIPWPLPQNWWPGAGRWRGPWASVGAGSLPVLPVSPHAVFSSAFRGTTGWTGSLCTIQLLLLRGATAQARSSKSSNPNASRRAAQS